MQRHDPYSAARDVLRSDWGDIEADLDVASKVMARIARERGWKFGVDARWSARQLRNRSGLTVMQVALGPDLPAMREDGEGTASRQYHLHWSSWRSLGPWYRTGQHHIVRRYSTAELADERGLTLDVEKALRSVTEASA